MRIRKPFKYPKTNEEASRYMQARYEEMDRAINSELKTLENKGITPSCKNGCSHCCRQLVIAAPLEGMTLLHFIQNQMEAEVRARLLDRTRAWFSWRESELPHKLPNGAHGNKSESIAHYNYGPHCPLLENDSCTIYEVRPMACRTHFVSSDPRGCLPDTDPLYMPGVWNELEVGKGVFPITQRIRKDCLKYGVDTALDGKLIPEWIKPIL